MTIKKRNYYIAASVILIGLLGLTACGKIDKLSFDETTVETTEAATAETGDQTETEEQIEDAGQTEDAVQTEETDPKETKVDKIDFSVSWEEPFWYQDEKEGYKREGTFKGRESSKYVESKLFIGKDSNSDKEINILVIHMHEEHRTEVYDADGNQITEGNADIIGEEIYKSVTSQEMLIGPHISQIGTHKDTGKPVGFQASRLTLGPSDREEGARKDASKWIEAQNGEPGAGTSGAVPAPSTERFYCYEVEKPDVPVTASVEVISTAFDNESVTPPARTKQEMVINLQ